MSIRLYVCEMHAHIPTYTINPHKNMCVLNYIYIKRKVLANYAYKKTNTDKCSHECSHEHTHSRTLAKNRLRQWNGILFSRWLNKATSAFHVCIYY